MRRIAIPIGFALLLLMTAPTFMVGAVSEASGASTPSDLDEVRASDSSQPKPVAGENERISRSPRDWYEMGGPTMHVLVLCSVLTFALVLERSFVLRRAAFVPEKLSNALRTAIEVGNRFELKSLCEKDSSALGKLARIALEGPQSRDRLGAEGSAVAHRAQRNLPFLAALGNLATMLGLLGTVLGMVEAFDVIAQSGTGDARIVAGGIFRALVTTAVGLTIAIFALLAHAVFSRRATDFVVVLETLITEITENVDRPNRPLGDAEAVEIL